MPDVPEDDDDRPGAKAHARGARAGPGDTQMTQGIRLRRSLRRRRSQSGAYSSARFAGLRGCLAGVQWMGTEGSSSVEVAD